MACSTASASWTGGALTVAPLDGTSPIYCYDQRPNGTGRLQAYRGSLQLVVGTQGLRAINQVQLDAYTAGVVPNEVPASNPTEALRAMAVVARTFASQRRGWHRGFDLCNTVHCQVYGGYLSETTSTTQAVIDTAGEMLRNPGAGPQGSDGTVDATFHAVCGGVGEAVERVWPQGAVGYLRGGPDAPAELPDLSDEAAFRQLIDHPPAAWCEASPRFRWTERYTLPQLQALFEESLPRTVGKAYQGLGTLRAVQVASRSPRGRVQALRIEGSIGSYLVEKDSIRWLWSRGILGQGGLQSTLFYLDTPEPGVIVIHGGGWGHGVGMCQDGAAGLARHGHTHATILEHYYPGTVLRGAKVDPTPSRSPADQAPGPPPNGSPPPAAPAALPLEAPASHSSPR